MLRMCCIPVVRDAARRLLRALPDRPGLLCLSHPLPTRAARRPAPGSPRPPATRAARCLLLLVALGAPTLRAQTPELRVDSDAPGVASSCLPQTVTTADGTVHVVWQDYRGPAWAVYYRRLPAFGAGASPPEVRLSMPPLPPGQGGNAIAPRIATDGNLALYVVWHTSMPDVELLMKTRSLDGGLTWAPASPLLDQITGLGVSSEYAGPPEIAADASGHVHVAWAQSNGVRDQIFYAVSLNRGTTWSVPPITQPVNVDTSGHSESPRLATDGAGFVYIAWLDHREPPYRDVWLRRSANFGLSWLPGEKRLNGHGSEIELELVAHVTSAAPIEHRVHAAWIDLSQSDLGGPLTEVRARSSYDGGLTWNTLPATVSDEQPDTEGQHAPAGSPAGGLFTAPGGSVGPLGSGGPPQGGLRGVLPRHVVAVTFNLDLALDGKGNVHAVYSRVDAPLVGRPTRVYHNRLDSETRLWGHEQPLSRGGVLYPTRGLPTLARARVAASAGFVYASWMQCDGDGDTRDEVLACWSTDNGLSWSAPSVVTLKPAGPGTSTSAHPALAALGNRCALVWDDRRESTDHSQLPLPPGAPIGAPDVFFRELPTH